MIYSNPLVPEVVDITILLYLIGLIKMGEKVRLAQVWKEEDHSCSSPNLKQGLLSSLQTLSSSLLAPQLLWITKHLLTVQEMTLIFRLVCLNIHGGSYLCWPVHSSVLHGDWCTTGWGVHTNFADKSVCLIVVHVLEFVCNLSAVGGSYQLH
jgi:hypothetical protein